MSLSPPITLDDNELCDRVEEYMGRWVPETIMKRATDYARRKLDTYRERYPDIEYYDDNYLVLLTADTVSEMELSYVLNTLSMCR